MKQASLIALALGCTLLPLSSQAATMNVFGGEREVTDEYKTGGCTKTVKRIVTYNKDRCFYETLEVEYPTGPDERGNIKKLHASRHTADKYCQARGYDRGEILDKDRTRKTRRSSYNNDGGKRNWRWDSYKTRNLLAKIKCISERCVNKTSEPLVLGPTTINVDCRQDIPRGTFRRGHGRRR